jgi:hypothetical protein
MSEYEQRLRTNLRVAIAFAALAPIPMIHITYFGAVGFMRIIFYYTYFPLFAIVVAGLALYDPLINAGQFKNLQKFVWLATALLLIAGICAAFFYPSLKITNR